MQMHLSDGTCGPHAAEGRMMRTFSKLNSIGLQELTIRDLNTGQLFVLAADETAPFFTAALSHMVDDARRHRVSVADFGGVLGKMS